MPRFRLVVSIRGPYGCRTLVLHGVLRAYQSFRYHEEDSPQLYQIIMFSDLECDYINPIDLCNKLNQVGIMFDVIALSKSQQFVLPENIAHAFLAALFLLSGQWIAFLLNLPLVAFNANKSVPFPILLRGC